MTLKLHHLNASRSQRLVWLIEELEIDCEIISYQRDTLTRLAPPELLTFHPMGKSPLLEAEGQIIAETGAIAQYLLAKYDTEHRLHPRPDAADFPHYLEWLHAAEGAVFLPGLITMYLTMSGLSDSPLAAFMGPEVKKACQTIEAHLTEQPYFSGAEFGAADCLMGFQVQALDQNGALETMPKTKAWLATVQKRPAYQRMLEIGI